MHSSTATLILTLVSQAVARGCSASANASTGKAVYFLTNDASNSVVALPIAADGTLSKGTVTSTTGKGSNSIDGTTNQPAAPDALVSQSSLTVAGNKVFAVNAGDNSLSMLSISSQDPTKLTMVGQAVAVPGEFPNTVAASMKNKLACVATSGATAGISCSTFSGAGLGAMDALRPIDLGQTTPPVGPTNTVSQVLFSADESSLLTMVKGDPATNKTGFVSVLPVQNGSVRRRHGGSGSRARKGVATLAQQDVQSSPSGTAVLFGSQLIPGTNNVFATDASFGAGILSIDQTTNQATLLAKQALDDQKATCWAAVSSVTGTAFVTDVGVPRIVEMSLQDASVVSQLDLSAGGDPGFIDLKAAGNFMYALSPGNGTTDAAIMVLDVSGGAGKAKMVQRFGLDGISGQNSQGMAILE